MKKIFALLAIAAICVQCRIVDELTTFNLDYTIGVTIPADNGLTLPLNILSQERETKTSIKFEENNTTADLIEKITVKTLTLDITSPEDGDFDFLDEIQVYLAADGLDEVEVAYRENVPDGASTLTLDLYGGDLSEYLKQDKIYLRVRVVKDGSISVDHEVDANVTFAVKAKVL